VVILLVLPPLAWKQLQKGTNILFITTSTSDELLGSVNIDDLEPPKCFFKVIFAISGCDTHFKSELRIKLLLFYCMLYTDCQSGRTAVSRVTSALLKLLVVRSDGLVRVRSRWI